MSTTTALTATSPSATKARPDLPEKGTAFDIVRLHFTAPLHLSDARPNDYGNSQRIIHSDALMAAICQAWAMLGKTEWIPKANTEVIDGKEVTVDATSPGFVLSSLFPFHGGKIADPERDIADIDPIYFLPKPYFQNSKEPRNDPERGEAKKFKKVQYIDTAFFSTFLTQQPPPNATLKPVKGAFRSEKLAGLSDDQAEFMTADVVPRIVKPRDESEPKPFYMERLYFRYDSGLWAIVHYDGMLDRAEASYRLGAALNYLADNGIGTDRAVGNGTFRWNSGKTYLTLPKTGRYAVNLSLFCPPDSGTLHTLLDNNARYDLVKRGGWLSEPHNTYRKCSVWMFREGGLMQIDSRKPMLLGKTVDLQPAILQNQHPVWRSGRALWLPVNLP